jgi:type II secretory pathway component PulF
MNLLSLGNAFMDWFVRVQFGGQQRARVYRKISSFLRNGVSLPETLRILHRFASNDGKKPKAPVAIVLKAWLDRVNNGMSLGRAIDGWVPPSDRIIIEAGEEAGSLAAALDNALFIQNSAKKIRSTIISGLAYPVLLIAMAFGLLILMAVRIVPAFASVLPRSRWEGSAALVAKMADFVDYGMAPTLISCAIIVSIMLWSMPRWVGRWRVYADYVVPWSLYRLSLGSGFMLSVSALVKAGVQIPEILRILMRGAQPWYRERMVETLKHVNNGMNLGEALYRTKLNFPDAETVKDLRAYAGFDNFDDILESLGKEWVDESVGRIQGQMSMLKNLAIIILGLVFGIIASGIFSLEQQVGTSI